MLQDMSKEFIARRAALNLIGSAAIASTIYGLQGSHSFAVLSIYMGLYVWTLAKVQRKHPLTKLQFVKAGVKEGNVRYRAVWRAFRREYLSPQKLIGGNLFFFAGSLTLFTSWYWTGLFKSV